MTFGSIEIQIAGMTEDSAPLYHATQTADGVRHVRRFGSYKTWTANIPRVSNSDKILIEALPIPAMLELDDGYRCYADATFSWSTIGFVDGELFWEGTALLTEVAND